VASSKRERELARMRAERQAARRAAEQERRHKQRQTVYAAVGGLLLVALVVGIVLLVNSGGSSKKDTVAQPAATGSPLASASATPAAAAGTCSYTSSGTAAKAVKGTPPAKPETTASKMVLKTNVGEVDIALNGAKAPCTVNSFAFLAGQKYFDGSPCHRLTTSGIYVLQCGDPTGTGTGGPGYQFADENLTGATYPKGTVAMANGGPGTNGSQFFLVYQDTQLPPSYTPFGTITKGLDVVTKVAKAGVAGSGGDGKPKLAVTIKTATVS
jgi:peptidyl-prolyl cis-trans isomerase B (cyclophilin B)